MPRYDPSTPVARILKAKQGGIQSAPLPPGSPSWDRLRAMTWGEVDEAANRGEPGYRTVRKLLTDSRFDR